MSKGLFAFFILGAITALVAVVILSGDWSEWFSPSNDTQSPSSFTPAEVEKIIQDWPIAMEDSDRALIEYRNIGGSPSGEAVIRKGVQANTFARLNWAARRAEYLISYLLMLRNSILKYSEQHRALGYFMEHYEQNKTVSAELKAWQIEQIDVLLKQINEAPDISEYPPGDVELMVRYFEQFHEMLVGYGRQPGFSAQRRASR